MPEINFLYVQFETNFFGGSTPGRKPLPVAVKKLKGTLQKCRANLNEPLPHGRLGEPSDCISDIAKEA